MLTMIRKDGKRLVFDLEIRIRHSGERYGNLDSPEIISGRESERATAIGDR